MNNFIFEYYQAITNGDEIVGRWIRLWYGYVIRGLEEKRFFYNPKKAARAIKFIEGFCRHSEGRRDLIRLELWQKATLSVIFGIVDENNIRQFRETFIVIGKKNGKTLLAAAIATYLAILDGEPGGKIYFVAPKLEQAKICYNAMAEMIRTDPELSHIGRRRRDDIFIETSNTTAKTLAFNARKSDGLNPSVVIMDEVGSWHGEAGVRYYGVIKSSAGARKQPLFASITTAGYESDGAFDEVYRRSTAVLMGNSRETRLAPFIYQIDDVDKWNDINEIRKANPNLGVSLSLDTVLEDIAIAEGSFSSKAEFLAKRCNIKQNSSAAWIDAQTIERISVDHFTLEDFRDSYAVVGVDLSQTTDLTAVVTVIERDKTLFAIAHFWLPSKKIEEATTRDGLPYAAYIQRGLLSPSGESFIDYSDIFNYIRRLIEEFQIYPLKIGYDRYSSQYLVQDLKSYGFHTDDVFQGENLTPVIDETEGLIKDGRIRIGDNDLMKAHLLNSALKRSMERNRKKLVKIDVKSSIHIDGTAALLDAMTVRQKYADEIGEQLKNERRT